jgi:membrane protein DedA with SNARE-associated domain
MTNFLSYAAFTPTNLNAAGISILVAAFVLQALKEIGIPSPGTTQSALIYAGYQFSNGNIFIALAVPTSILMGSISGSCCMYFAAKFLGFKLIEKFGKYLRVTPESLERAKNKMRPAAFLPVVVGRSIPGMMMPTSIASGVMHLPVSRFITGVSISVIVWAIVFIALGTLSAQIIDQLSPLIESIPLFLGLLIGCALIFALAYYFLKNRLIKRFR